jgi:glyoxylase-like metal-dependent hydrolase (beta-lactamase superfamily II)
MMQRRQFLAAGLSAGAASSFAFLAASGAWAQNTPNLGTPTPASPGFRRMKVGDAEVIALNDGVARRPLGEEFVKNAPLAEVRALLASQGLPTEYIDVPFNPFLVVAGNRRILMDTGLGEFGAPTTGKLLEQLRAVGVQPGDIDTVLITHYHGDHIGGLRNKAGEYVFAKAKVLVPAPEHAFWMDDAKMAAAPEGMKGAFNNVRRVFA